MLWRFSIKKTQTWEMARNIVSGGGRYLVDERMIVEACIELAKIYEHRLKDYQLAIRLLSKGISCNPSEKT